MNDNIFLVGVSGVGKSTLGYALSDYLNVNFYSADDAYLNEKEKTWEELEKEFGEGEVNQDLFHHFSGEMEGLDGAIVDVSPRTFLFPELWELISSRGTSIHLAGMARDSFDRREQRGYLNPESENYMDDQWSSGFKNSWYKHSMYISYISHYYPCLQADFTVHIEGNARSDSKALLTKVKAIQAEYT